MSYCLGIDTSCYTTSLALIRNGELLVQKRKLLEVPQGERGLQQSTALFQHIQNLPLLFAELFKEYPAEKVCAVCASTRPRPVDGSYMPVFTASQSYGETVATVLEIPMLATSHQEGHIMAGIWSANGPREREFLALHLSGGTTELLKVRANDMGSQFVVDLLGGSNDLHAGQFIDRIGVALGLGFPAGPALEQLAAKSKGGLRIPSSVQNLNISFSGPETAAQKLIKENHPPADIARAVEHCIATSVEKLVRRGVEQYNIKSILIVGGVAANQYIRQRLKERLEHRTVGAELYFAEPQYSTDNAVGVALIGEKLATDGHRCMV